ncbi:hypothetical protein DFH27DRAFT_526079 [Peziza echinospora]|nr:hypothetical protein DFH27DRAFT_526079 [Peziza echinospora]
MPTEDMTVDHYAALQVRPSAQASEIKSSYRKLALLYHPDRNHGKEEEANRKFQAIQAAYEVLNDPTRRAKYDRTRLTGIGVTTSTASTASKASGFASSTTQSEKPAASKTANRYTTSASYASSSAKPERAAQDFKHWATGGYSSKAGYRSDDREKAKTGSARDSDDDRKRRERERENERANRAAREARRAKEFVRAESPIGTPRRSKESAYSHYTSSRTRHAAEDSRSRNRSPDHTPSAARATADSDQEYSRSWTNSKSAYSHTPQDKFTLRPTSPLPETRPSSDHRYTRNESSQYYSASHGERYTSSRGSYPDPKKSRADDSDRRGPPSPPPEERSSKFSHTFKDINGEEPEKKDRRGSTHGHRKSTSTSKTWAPPHAEDVDDSDGMQADDEKPSDERTFEEQLQGLHMGGRKKADDKKKSPSWEGLKDRERKYSTSRPYDTPRRSPSPYAAPSPKQSTHLPTPNHATPNPTLNVPPPSVFAYEVPSAAFEVPPASTPPSFNWAAPVQPTFAAPPPAPFANYVPRPPVSFAAPHVLPTFQPPVQHPFTRPQSTQPSSGQTRYAPPNFSQSDLNKVFENLNPANGIPTKKSEPSLRTRSGRARKGTSKLSTKFAQLNVSENNNPVKDSGSDHSKKDETSSRENLKTASPVEDGNSSAMDIDPPTTPQPSLPTPVQPPKHASDGFTNGKPAKAPDLKTRSHAPTSPNGFFGKQTKSESRPDPFMFANLANVYPINAPINAAEILNGLKMPYKAQTSPTTFDPSSSKSTTATENSLPQPPKPPSMTLLIANASGKLDMTEQNPYWSAMQAYVDQWREYESKMKALLKSKVEDNTFDYNDILTDVKKAREYSIKAQYERLLREEWMTQQQKFIATIIEYHQVKVGGPGILTPPVTTAANTSFLGGVYSKSKVFPNIAGLATGMAGPSVGPTSAGA